MGAPLKITVAEPSVILRSGMLAVLEHTEKFKAEVYEVSDMEHLKAALNWQHPDVLMVNPASLGLYALQQLRKEAGNPQMKCVAVQLTVSDQTTLRSYDEVISIYDDAETIVGKLLKLTAGGEQRDRRHEALSGREKEVIACVVQGMTNKQIADRLCISTHTVITHRRNIAAKLDIHSPAGLTIYAIVNKLVELDAIRETVGEPGES